MTIVLLVVCSLVLKSWHWGSIAASLFWGYVFLYKPFLYLLEFAHMEGIRHRYTILLWTLLFLAVCFVLLKIRKEVRKIAIILSVTSFTLVAIPAISASHYKIREAWNEAAPQSNEFFAPENVPASQRVGNLPDIYYIILDRYGQHSTLKQLYGFDNSEFYDYLRGKGFFIADESHSNYGKTCRSLASSLNMEYLDDLRSRMNDNSDNLTPLHEMCQDYRVWRFLKARGYKFIHMGSWWGVTMENRHADVNINYRAVPELLTGVYKKSIFSVHFYPAINRRTQRERVLYKFAKLAEIAKDEKPTFVFAHMLIPHNPYVFDKNGDFLSEEEAGKRDVKTNYIEQLAFTNKLLRELVDKILSDSKTPPIIILQADEGPFPARYAANEKTFSWKQATASEIREKMRIFNAYYLPNVDKSALYPSITPVNTFRVIFNLYFDGQYELLPDRSYLAEDMLHPYKFFEVTEVARYNPQED